MDDQRSHLSPTIELSRDHVLLGTDRLLRERHARGELIRLVKGAYVDRDAWITLKPYRRYRVRVLACARLWPMTEFSHVSAAALWGLPLPNDQLAVHARRSAGSGGRSGVAIQRHGLGHDPNAVVIDGARVTSLALTMADNATMRDRGIAVSVLDAGLARPSGPSKSEVTAVAMELGDPRCMSRVLRAIDFADPRAKSPGESLSRVQIHALGFPEPELQVEIRDDEGLAGIVDFAWPKLGIVGEFDGQVKYGEEREFELDKSAREVVVDEKRREDRIRRVVRGFARWDWAEARDRARLAQILEQAGLRR